MPSPPLGVASVCQLLNQAPTDADFNAFCLDYFPDVQRQFGTGMDRVQKINLLLELALIFIAAWTSSASVLESWGLFVFHPHRLSNGQDGALSPRRRDYQCLRA